MGRLDAGKAGIAAVALLTVAGAHSPASGQDAICIECISVRVGTPLVVRGPFPDEIDAPFSLIRLDDGVFRGFSANSSTYAIDTPSLDDLGGPRREVMAAGPAGAPDECGRWLTSVTRSGADLIGLVHREAACDYDEGRTHKSMAIARSSDNGLNWDDLGTILTGRDAPQAGTITGEGDCTMIDGHDGYLYAYCLRNSDWQTIVARAAPAAPTEWFKFFEGDFAQPGVGGEATAIGFFGTGTGFLQPQGWVAAVTVDPWFNGVRLSLSQDKVSFLDLKEPLTPIDGSDWQRPAPTALIAYATLLDPAGGGSTIGSSFLMSYSFVPANAGFDSRYLVLQPVTINVETQPVPVQVGLALTRWSDAKTGRSIATTGPLTGETAGYGDPEVLAYALTREPEALPSVKLAECSRAENGRDQMLAPEGQCEAEGYSRERTAGWLLSEARPDMVALYSCRSDATETHFVSVSGDCEGRGSDATLLGYGFAP